MATQQPVLVLGPGDDGQPVSDEEYLSAEFEGPWRYELVDGRLAVMSPNSEVHDDTAEPWRNYLGAYKLAHRDRVQKVVSEAWVRVRQGQFRIGDIGVYLVSERSVLRRPARAPELMIEVVSPGRDSAERDYVEKRADYHAIGVLEYVIVDYLARKVSILTHTPAGYEERVLTEADTYTSPLLPGLAIPLAEVFGG
jgi:Uma2 family endonuclease